MDELDKFFPRDAPPPAPAPEHPRPLSWARNIPTEQPAQKKPRRKRGADIGQAGEAFAKRTLNSVLDASLSKCATTQGRDRDGQTITVSTDVDFVGVMHLDGWENYPIHVEVKSTATALSTAALTKAQHRYLQRAERNDEGALVALVQFAAGSSGRAADVERFALLTYRMWRVAGARLEAIAKTEGGRWQGKSIRPQDWEAVFGDCLISKHGRRWELCDSHWLKTKAQATED